MQAVPPILKICRYTIIDHVRQKSFIVMLLIGAAFVFFTRSCYHGNYMVNGQMLGAWTVAESIAKMSFHTIAFTMMFLAALLAVRAFSRDRDYGMQACILSKPITRGQYVTGKVLGLWALAFFCMFILHAMVFLIMALQAKVFMPAFLAASLLCSLNVLVVVMGALVLSLSMSDFVAFMAVMAITVISFVADGIHTLHQSQMLQAIIQPHGTGPQSDVTWRTVIYYLWPKISELEITAASLIDHGWLRGWGALYPLANILAYCLIAAALLLWRFRREEIL